MVSKAELEARREQDRQHTEMEQFAKWHICAACQGLLVVIWEGKANEYQLKCGKNKAHEGFISWKESRREQERRDMERAMTVLPINEEGMLARIERAKFPQALTAEEKKTLALAALSYGFDPLMGELTIYQGRPYVSIDGRYRKAQETGKLGGVETRPATKAEKTAWEIPEGDYFMRAEVWVKDIDRPFVGWGRVRAKETEAPRDITKAGYRPLETNPQRMAEKRAEAQALRKAFSINLPSLEDIGGEVEGSAITILNPKTGELTNGKPAQQQVNPPTIEAAAPGPAEAPASPAKPPAGSSKALSPDRVDALSRLLTAAGHLPGSPGRESILGKVGVDKLADMQPEQAAQLEAWAKTKAKEKGG